MFIPPFIWYFIQINPPFVECILVHPMETRSVDDCSDACLWKTENQCVLDTIPGNPQSYWQLVD